MDDAYDLYKFYLAREGSLHSFRLKDPWDYSTAGYGRGTPTATDQYIGQGDGLREAWQVRKTYTSGSTDIVRYITKPVDGTSLVALDAVPQGSGWTVNANTGLLVFDGPVPNGLSITWGAEFDCEARFGVEADEAFHAAFDNYELANLSIPIIEVIDEVAMDSNITFGGYKDHGSITDDISISLADGLLHVMDCDQSGHKLFLPDESNLPYGHLFTLDNTAGSQSIAVRYNDDTAFYTLASGGTIEVYLAEVSSTATWKAI
jgi:uncharacterized protein (TIGR02217 family)